MLTNQNQKMFNKGVRTEQFSFYQEFRIMEHEYIPLSDRDNFITINLSPSSMLFSIQQSSNIGGAKSNGPLRFRLLDGIRRSLISHLIKHSPLCLITHSNLSIQFWNTLWSPSKVTLLNRSVSPFTPMSASANLRFCNAVLTHPKTQSCPDSDQPNKMDVPVFRSLFGQLPAMFPRVMHWAIIHVNFHRLCDPVSSAVIALRVNTFLITFLVLSSIDKRHQPVGGEKYCDHHFFRPYRP
jgi:hypothetical protein